AVLGSPKFGVVETDAFLLGQQSDAALRSVDEPVPTIAQAGAIGKVDVEPFIFNMAHTGENTAKDDASRCKSTADPLSTVNGKGMFGLVEAEPFLVNMKGQSEARDIEEPTFTQTKKHHQYLA